MNTHCCQQMREHVNFQCDRHKNAFECPDALVGYEARYDEYGLVIHDGGQRNQWFDELEALGFDDPATQEVPAKYNDDAWNCGE